MAGRSSVSVLAAALLCFSTLLLVSSRAEALGVNSTLLPKSLMVHVLIDGTKNVSVDNTSSIKYKENFLTISWKLNASFIGKDSAYKQVLLKFCYGQASAMNRKWRKNDADLSKSKTCHTVIKRFPYLNGSVGNSTVWYPPDDVPTAYWFVRAFALNSSSKTAGPGDSAVAIGSSTNMNRTSSLIHYTAYSGRSTGIVIGLICFSLMSYILLFSFFFVERVLTKNA
eukprot:TRINITY_DN20771_c0_g1_i1.p1 TRINITY_DN20771_c0_g1~~TRINITY_DN20771_c0_g1_i1.p1  ORF type:complete len:226 (+),score=24.81 TRINITY_DN20771_c0_g1_i1:189-866(+)